MAYTGAGMTDGPAAAAARRRGSGIVVGADRSKDFRAARRHTLLVKSLRLMLPFASLALAGFYVVAVMKSDLASELPEMVLSRIVPKNLTMENPNYEGFNADGSRYKVSAKIAVQDIKRLSQIKLFTITGELTATDKAVTRLYAQRGMFDTSSNILRLAEKIIVQGDDGLKATLSTALVDTRKGLVESATPVRVEMPAGTVDAKAMKLRHKLRQFTFTGDVKTLLNEQKPGRADFAAAVAAETPAAGASQPFGAGGGPISVLSQRLDIDDLAKTAVFTGNVSAVQTGSTITTPELQVTYEGSAAPGGSTGGGDEAGSKVKLITAKAPVRIVDRDGSVVTSDGAVFDAAAQTANLAGNVRMVQAADRQTSSQSAILNQSDNSVVLQGDVVVVQGQNVLKGRRLWFDQTTNKMQVTSPSDVTGPGRVTARFVQKSDGKAKPRKSTPVQTSPFGATFNTDQDAPINIEADRLDVDDGAKKAIFRGDVRVAQGDFKVRTSELHTTYKGGQGFALNQKSAEPAPADGGLSRIEAKGKVVITSKEGQNASGDWADFDVAGNEITLGGDVVLTQGQNVVRGTRLAIDTTTGQSIIKTAGGGAVATTPEGQQPGVAGFNNSARPRAVFYPDQIRQQAEKKSGPGANIGGGWTSETRDSP